MSNFNLKLLYDYYLKQKKSNKLIRLPKDFYENSKLLIKKLTKDLKELSELEHDDFDTYMSLLMKREKALAQAKKILENIFKLRISLILQIANSLSEGNINIKIDALTPEEEELFDKLVKNIKEFRVSVVKRVIKGEDIISKEENDKFNEEDYLLVIFKDFVPKFVYKDLKTYGPFEPEEIANLPEGAVKILESKKKIEFI